jgi:hypothetical protein
MGNEQSTIRLNEEDATNILVEEYNKNTLRNNKIYSNFDPNTLPKINYDYTPKILPTDAEGYVTSFTIDQKEEYKKFFEEYGVVVIRDILNDKECRNSVNEAWDFLERHHVKLDRNDISTWTNDNFPSLSNLGILGNTPVLSKQFFENRQNPKLYSVYSTLLQSNKLWSNIGRASIIRPTKNIIINGELVDKPEWKTLSEWLHLDMNPFTGATTTFMYKEVNPEYNNSFDRIKLQGTLTLVDCGPEDGGFHCVPGFHKYVEAYGKVNKDLYDPASHSESFDIPEQCEIRKDIQKVPARAGSSIIWSSATPHGTFPNNSCKPRIVQYVHMVKCDDKELEPILNNKKYLPHNFRMSKLGSKLLGFGKWT